MNKHYFLGLLLALSFLNGFSQETRVIPLVLDPLDMELEAVDYVEVAYFLTPDSQPIFEEMAEKIWRIQDRPLLILGSTGVALPSHLVGRAELFVDIFLNGQPMWDKPHILHPQKEAIAISPNAVQVVDNLKTSLSKATSLGSSYLAELANYLAGNLSAINMSATSYSIEGYGEVINTSGEWLGVPISGGGDSVWTKNGDQVYLNSEYVGIGNTNPQIGAKLSISATNGAQSGIQIDNVTSTSAIKVNSGTAAYEANATNWGGYFHGNNIALRVEDASTDGIVMDGIGSPSGSIASSVKNGIEIQGTEGSGLWVGQSDSSAIAISRAGNITFDLGFIPGDHGISIGNTHGHGVAVRNALSTGFFVQDAGVHGIMVKNAGINGVQVTSAANDGVNVTGAGSDGITVETATKSGVHVLSSGESGVLVDSAGTNGIEVSSSSHNGVLIENARWAGLRIEDSLAQGITVHRSGWDGIAINGTGDGYHGLNVSSTGANGDAVHIVNASRDGIRIENATSDGIQIDDAGSDAIEVAGATLSGLRVYNTQYGVRSYSNDYGVYVSSCPIAGYFQGTGGGLTSPALRADATNTINGIAAHFTNDSADSTVVIENDSGSINAHLIKGFRDGVAMFRVTNMGQAYANSFNSGGADLAESFDVDEDKAHFEPGDVMVISSQGDRLVGVSQNAYSPKVAGVYATKPGVILGPDVAEGNRIPLGVVGVIPTKVNLDGGVIQPGDLLVTSSDPGVAMKADPARLVPGCVIGKALQLFEGGQDSAVIEVLVNVK